MKSKKATYILLPLVVVIWAYVAYSIITYGEPETTIDPIRVGDIVASKQEDKVDRPLSLNYPDPFLKSVAVTRLETVSSKGNTAIRKPQKQPDINWGDVTYNGYIRNNQKKTKIALLNINGNEVLGERGDTYGGLTVILIRQDSVQLQSGRTKKWFVISKK